MTIQYWYAGGRLPRLGRTSAGSTCIPWNIKQTDALLTLLMIGCVVRLWLMPLGSSFWVDEMVTAFIAENGATHASLAVAPQVTASIYYALVALVPHWLWSSEVLYRLPSVLAMALAVFFVVRISCRIIHPSSAWFTAFACIALPGMNYQAADARPYALGTCIAAGALFWLISWLHSNYWKDAAVFVVLAAMLWRVHLLYWPLYLCFGAYAFVRIACRQTNVSLFGALVVFSVIGLMLIPVFVDASKLIGGAHSHTIVPIPTTNQFIRSLNLKWMAWCLIGAWFLRRWDKERFFRFLGRKQLAVNDACPISPNPRSIRYASSSIVLILGWWLCQPLSLFLFSRLTGISVFVPRYLSVSLPGAVLAVACLTRFLLAPGHLKRASMILGVGALLVLGQWRHFLPRHDPSDWRAAADAVNSMGLTPKTPMICPSPFVEARTPVWRPDYQIRSFLYAHLCWYGVRGKLFPFPYEKNREAESYAAHLTEETLVHSDRFLIYGGLRITTLWQQWFAKQPQLSGWTQEKLGDFGDVAVVLFKRTNRGLKAATVGKAWERAEY